MSPRSRTGRRRAHIGCDATLSASSRSPPRFRRTSSSSPTPKPRLASCSAGARRLFDRLSGVFDNAGIAQRHIVAPIDWYERPHGWHDRNARLSRSRGRTVRRSGCDGDRASGPDARPNRRRRHRLDHRHRHAQPRRARSARGSACATTSAACRSSAWAAPAGSTAWPPPRGSPRPSRAAAGCSSPSKPARSRSASTATIPPRSSPPPCSATAPPRPSSQPASDRPRARSPASGEKTVARHARHHGLAGRGSRPRRRLRPRHPAVHRGRTGRRGRRHARRSIGVEPRRHRPLLLPPRRGQGDRRDRDRARAAVRATLDLEREVLRDYGNMSAPTVLFVLDRLIAARPAGARADDRLRPRLHLRRAAARSGMIWPAIAILAFVTLQRLVELWLSQRATRGGCSRKAARRGRPRPLSADRRGPRRLAGSAVVACARAGRSTCRCWSLFVLLAAGARLGACGRSGQRWTTRIIVAARRAAGRARALPLRRSSQLSDRRRARSRCCRWSSACGRSRSSSALLNAAVLAVRIRAENRALGPLSYRLRLAAARAYIAVSLLDIVRC